MRITDVRVLEHERVMPPGMGPPTARINVVTIATDDGIDGHVFVTGPGVDVTPQLLGDAKQLLVGRDPLDIGAIWHDFRLRARMFDPTVQGYVDIALWYIAGKAADLPVHRLLGSSRSSVPSYASSWVHASNATYVEEALAYRERGFVGYKLHPPTQRRRMPIGGPPGPVSIIEDIDTCAAVREAVGDDYCLTSASRSRTSAITGTRIRSARKTSTGTCGSSSTSRSRSSPPRSRVAVSTRCRVGSRRVPLTRSAAMS